VIVDLTSGLDNGLAVVFSRCRRYSYVLYILISYRSMTAQKAHPIAWLGTAQIWSNMSVPRTDSLPTVVPDEVLYTLRMCTKSGRCLML